MRTFTIVGTYSSPFVEWFMNGVKALFEKHGYRYVQGAQPDVNLYLIWLIWKNPVPSDGKHKGHLWYQL